jgi:hypothetical protein
VEQELLTLPEHLSSSSIFSGVGVTPYLVICVFFVDRCYCIKQDVRDELVLSMCYKMYM